MLPIVIYFNYQYNEDTRVVCMCAFCCFHFRVFSYRIEDKEKIAIFEVGQSPLQQSWLDSDVSKKR